MITNNTILNISNIFKNLKKMRNTPKITTSSDCSNQYDNVILGNYTDRILLKILKLNTLVITTLQKHKKTDHNILLHINKSFDIACSKNKNK